MDNDEKMLPSGGREMLGIDEDLRAVRPARLEGSFGEAVHRGSIPGAAGFDAFSRLQGSRREDIEPFRLLLRCP